MRLESRQAASAAGDVALGGGEIERAGVDGAAADHAFDAAAFHRTELFDVVHARQTAGGGDRHVAKNN